MPLQIRNNKCMPEGLYITRVEWNQLMKRMEYLEQYLKLSLRNLSAIK